VRAELLPPLSAGGTTCGASRYLDQSRRIPVCRPVEADADKKCLNHGRTSMSTSLKCLSEQKVERNAGGSTRCALLLAGGIMLAAASLQSAPVPAQAQPATQRPNILVIFGDDIGYWNLSAYSQGMMGYRTPNLDRIAREGAMFTDYYAQQSCTAGRAAFITGQTPFRTGLLKVGLPGARLGLQKEDPTIADLLKNQGYMTFQHGKNHLGDRNEFLPTMHGFDEFFGNLYHLNAEEEPENVDYPKSPQFHARFGPRGVLRAKAVDRDDPTDDPRFGRIGKQTIEDTGPLTTKRMEKADEEFLAATLGAMDRAKAANRPFFIWHNMTRMHVFTHLQKKYQDMVAEKGLYGAGMTELDDHVGVMLKKLDDLGIANNTIVIFTSDNGAETFLWPDGGTTPFRGEKNTNWEGGFRVPCVVRWPGVIRPGTVINDVMSHEDWMPTLLAAAGDPNVKDKLKKGHQANGKSFKVHLDGYNQLDVLTSKGPGARREFYYFSDDGDPDWPALRQVEDRVHGTARARHERVAKQAVAAAPAEILRLACRSVRAGGHRSRQLRSLVG
jgi:arylsulfatase